MADCLDNLIGLTETTCDCWDDTKPQETWEALNATSSGLYVTDPEFGFEPLDAAIANADCGDGSIWQQLEKARNQAIRQFKIDVSAQIQSLYKNQAQFSGLIGRNVFSRAMSSVKPYAGIVLYPRRWRGASLILSHVHLGVDISGAIDVVITSNNPGYFTPVTQTVTAVGGQFVRQALETPVELPFTSIYREGDLRYYAYFEVPGGTFPLANNFACCSGKTLYDKFLGAGGFEADTTDEIPDIANRSTAANGLALEGYIQCSEIDWLCELDTVGGYSVKMVVARALQMKAAITLYSMQRNSTAISRFTEQTPATFERIQELSDLYFNQIKWIAQNIPANAVDCLLCRDKAVGGWAKKAIVV
jgi:hypothetical protein